MSEALIALAREVCARHGTTLEAMTVAPGESRATKVKRGQVIWAIVDAAPRLATRTGIARLFGMQHAPRLPKSRAHAYGPQWRRPDDPRPDPSDIVRDTARKHHVPVIDVVTGVRRNQVALARNAALHAVVTFYPEIPNRNLGDLFDRCSSWASHIRRQEPPGHPYPDPQEVLREFARERMVSLRDVLSNDRFRSIVDVRHDAIREVARQCPNLALTSLGKLFGRDHTSIMNALRRGRFGQRQRVAA